MRSLAAGTDGAGGDKILSVQIERRSPKASPDDVQGPLKPRMAGPHECPHWSTCDLVESFLEPK